MTKLATLGAETSVRTATTLLYCECTLETPGTVQIHGLGTTRRGLVAMRGGREGKGTRGRARRRLGGRLGARAGCSNRVLLNINGCRKVSMEGGGEAAASGKLEPDSSLNFRENR